MSCELSIRTLRAKTLSIHRVILCSVTSQYYSVIRLGGYWRPIFMTQFSFVFQVWCRGMHIIVQYFMVANYFWMFCEGKWHLYFAFNGNGWLIMGIVEFWIVVALNKRWIIIFKTIFATRRPIIQWNKKVRKPQHRHIIIIIQWQDELSMRENVCISNIVISG